MSKFPEELAAQAEAFGLALEAYVEQILSQQIREPKPEGRTPRTPKEIHAWLGFIGSVFRQSATSPEKISREWIYQDHN